MKYLFYTFLIITSLFSEQRVLKISNFIDYINIDLLKEFAYQNDIKIIYDIHEINEEIYSKVKENNDFDLLILSSNYITKLAKIDKLEKIDISKLKNYSNINQEFLQTNFSDTKEFTIPYLWGTVGLIYNKKLIKEPITQWNDLWRDEFKNAILLVVTSCIFKSKTAVVSPKTIGKTVVFSLKPYTYSSPIVWFPSDNKIIGC